MIKLFLICFTGSITSFAQIELNGRVTNEQGEPLARVIISIDDSVARTQSDSTGHFEVSISADSAIVIFKCLFYRPYKFKVFASQSIEIKLRDISHPRVTWNLEKSDKPLYKEKDKQGVTHIFGSETVVLPTRLSAVKVVLWKYEGYEITLPFDSLREHLNKVGYPSDANFDQNMLSNNLKSDTMLLSSEFVQEVGESTLMDLAINMLKARNIIILDMQKRYVPTVIVRLAYWYGRCNLCFWSGIQFVVPGRKEPLFSITHIIS
jgi:hypothetical protein